MKEINIISMSPDEFEQHLRGTILSCFDDIKQLQSKEVPQLYNVKQVSVKLGVTSKTVYNYIRLGLLTPFRVEGVVRISSDELNRFIKQHSTDNDFIIYPRDGLESRLSSEFNYNKTKSSKQ